MKMKKLTASVVIIFLVLGLLVGSFGCAAPAPTPTPTTPTPTTPTPTKPAEVIKFKAQTAYNWGTPPWSAGEGHLIQYPTTYGIVKPYIDWLNEVGKGVFEIDMAPPGTIVPVMEMFRAVETGTLDMIFTYPGFYAGIIPEANIEQGLPYGWEDNEEAWDGLLNWGMDEIYKDVYAEYGIKWFACPANCYYHFGTTFICDSPDTIAGKKIRAIGAYADYVVNLGGSATVIPAAEIYMALKLGTVDGVIYGKPGLEDWKWKEILKSWVDSPNTGIAQTCYQWNMDSWNKIPADLREIIERDSYAVIALATQNYWTEAKYYGASGAKEYGLKNLVWSAEDAMKGRAAGIATWDKEAAKSPICAQLVEILKKQAIALGKME